MNYVSRTMADIWNLGDPYQVWHSSDAQCDQRSQHFPTFFCHKILRNPLGRAVPKREFFGELGKIVASS